MLPKLLHLYLRSGEYLIYDQLVLVLCFRQCYSYLWLNNDSHMFCA